MKTASGSNTKDTHHIFNIYKFDLLFVISDVEKVKEENVKLLKINFEHYLLLRYQRYV